jgi:hypothetical protein
MHFILQSRHIKINVLLMAYNIKIYNHKVNLIFMIANKFKIAQITLIYLIK